MSEFVHCFKNFDTSVSFIKTFFATEAREWSGTDRLRMDKFMMVRYSIIYIFPVLFTFTVAKKWIWRVSQVCSAWVRCAVLWGDWCVVQLIRRMLRQSFILLRRRGWLLSDVSCLANTLHVTVLDALNDHIPDGIRFHLNDIFIEELDRIAGNCQVSLVIFCFELVINPWFWYMY